MSDTNCPDQKKMASTFCAAACAPETAQTCSQFIIESNCRVLHTFNKHGIHAQRFLPHYQRALLAAQLKLGHLMSTSPHALRHQEIQITYGKTTRQLAILAPKDSPLLQTDHIDITHVPDTCPQLAAPKSALWLPSKEPHAIADNPILGQSGVILTPIPPQGLSYDPAEVVHTEGTTIALTSAEIIYKTYTHMFPEQAKTHQMPPRAAVPLKI